MKSADVPAPAGQPTGLPADRSFVLQLRADAGVGPDGPWSGRVEHVMSGEATRFEDCAALCDFIVRTLRAQADR